MKQEIMTGKAKEDFEKWLREYLKPCYDELINAFEFDTPASRSMQSGVILEWLDSKKIYIKVAIAYPHAKQVLNWYYVIQGTNEEKDGFDDRNTALTQAITKAVEIYNERITL